MPDEPFENTVEDETGANDQTDEEEAKVKEKDSNSVGGPKQGKVRSASYDGGDKDRFSSSSKRQAAIQNGSGTRSGRPSKDDAETIPVVNPVAQQPAIPPPWPEWSDDFINEETWDVDTGIDYFEDVFAATDFLNLKAYHWMRPSEFLREPPVVVRFSSSVIDLITPNAHLCEKSEVLRYILSEISELYDYSIQNKFVECEGEGVAYVPNYAEDDRKWTPWSHIYSCCKAGVRGERPVYNSKGKYYVRLYFLGSWRRILVDDRVPVLPSGQSGLPLTTLNELWPLLLTKALLKVATVSWKGDDVKKFSAISALTGWVFEWIDSMDGVNESELWADLENTLPKYNNPKRIPSCYTLLRPSKKKMKFGNNIEESDTFWWMPPMAVHPSDMEDATLKEQAEDEPFELEVTDIVSSIHPHPMRIEPSEDEEETQMMIPKTPLDVKWVRKTVKEPPPSRTPKSTGHHEHESKHATDSTQFGLKPEQEGQEPEDEKPDNLLTVDGMTVAKKKKKKGGIGAALEDSKSEKKSMGAKKHKKPKELEVPDGIGAKSKAMMKKKSRQVSTTLELQQQQQQQQDTTEGEEEPTDTERLANRRKSVKLKGHMKEHWNKLKAIIIGDADEVVNVRMSKSGRRSLIDRMETVPGKEGKKSRRKRKDTGESEPEISLPEQEVEAPKKKPGLPSVPEILYGVQKYAGLDYRNIVKNWENICGKDSPLALVVVLKEFPSPEEETLEGPKPHVPPFLQHPIQLTEVRDSVLQKQTDRPETPLWKRFRWKKWAMKKGLIPLEVDHSNDVIRAVKAKTPFVFKQDWYDFTTGADLDFDEEEQSGEFDGEDDDDNDDTMQTFFFSLKSARNKNKRSSPVTTEPSVIPPINIQQTQTPPSPPTDPANTKGGSPPQASVLKGKLSKTSMAPLPLPVPTTPTLQPPVTLDRKSSKIESTRTRQSEGLGVLAKDNSKHQSSRKSMTTTKSGAGAASERKASVQKADTDKGSSKTDEGSEGQGSNMTVILHESEIVQGESDEDFDHAFKRKMLKAQEYIVPTSACVSLWFNCDDIARNLRKFCKFYNSQSIFGSCYILRREPRSLPFSPSDFPEIQSDLPKYPETLTEFKLKKDCLNFGIEFDRWKNYHVTDYHMDDKEDTDSGFYMFSDCWTEQELIITVHVLQEEFMNQYKDATAPLKEEMPGPPPTPTSRGFMNQPKTPKPPDIPLTLAIEPWDWRQGVSLTQPLLICTWIKDRWISHVSIPAGRNTFRIWLLYQNPTIPNSKGATSISRFRLAMGSSSKSLPTTQDSELGSVQSEPIKKKNNAPFSVRIVSQTPIYVGSKEKVMSYMTNPPMLFLKQCERLSNNLWGLFACYGKKFPAYNQNLRQLRRSYCPAYSQPNMINKFVRGSHDTFEELFVSLIATFNNGRLDRMMVLTLRVLFLNPMIGRKFASHGIRKSEDSKMFQGVFKGLGKKAKFFLMNAANTIQRYYRGWRVRNLFQLRRRSHRDFKKIEYNVRRIAFLLARETDSIFSQKDYETNNNDPETFSVADMTVDPEKVPPTILPSPPHWAVDLLRFLLERHPWLITLYPHANCIPHHVKVQEVQGELPQRVKDFPWYPFFREVLKVPADSKSCFIELDLQVYPSVGIHMKIINNDNGKFLRLNSNRHFSGRVYENKYGYTVLCYKWSVATLKLELNDRPPSTFWKLRLVTPHEQEGPRFMTKSELYLRYADSGEGLINEEENENKMSDEAESEGEVNRKDSNEGVEKRNSQVSETEDKDEFPRKLTLRRLSGYYTPNKDYSVCQYILETDEKRASISLRFMASNENVRLKVLVWDCVKRAIVFEEIFESGLIAPYIQLHLVKPKPKPSESDFPTTDDPSGDVRLTSPLSLEDLENSSSEFFDGIMSNASYASKVLSKVTLDEGDDDEEEEWDGEERSRKSSSAETADVVPSASGKQGVGESGTSERKMSNKRRYIISVYVMEESWPLTDRELLYVLYRERKFFKSIKAHHCSELKKEKDAKAKLDEEAKATTTTTGRGSTAENDKLRSSGDQHSAGKSGRQMMEIKVTSAIEVDKPSNPNTATDLATPNEMKYKDFQSVKRKTKRKDMDPAKETPSAPPPTQQGESNPQTPRSPPTQATASETTIGFGDDFSKILAEKKQRDQGKIKRRGEGNLVVKYGGHQSQYVKHLDQPHWIMEIVTDSKTKYKLKSNWSILRKRLLLAKDSWEKGGVEVVYQDLSTRLDFLLENMVEENYYKIKLHKFSIVDPITNLYSILRLDEYDLREFVNHEFIRLLVKVWSTDPEENKRAGEKFLQNRLKKMRTLEAAANEKDKDKDKKDTEAEIKPTPEQLLDYVPKNLRKMAEVFHQRIVERELEKEKERERERERLLQEEREKLGLSNEDEKEEEDEEEEEQSATSKKKSTAPTEAHLSATTDGENLTVRQSHHHLTAKSLRKTIGDAKSERTAFTRKMKKVPTQHKLADNATSYTKATSKKLKSEKERSSSLKGKEAKSTTAEADSAPTPKKTSKAESGARSLADTDTKEPEPEETYETELARIRQCEYVAGIFKKYEQFFKEPKTVKQTLTEVIERGRQTDNEEGPKKLLLTKTGISKYSEKRQEKKGKENNEEESEEGSKEEKVANKLLQWAYDYTFLPPTEEYDEVIQDPCDLPLFFMRTIMAEQRERERKEEELAAARAAAELAALEAEMEEE